LNDKDSETRLDAAFVLATIGGPVAVEALPVLRAALKDGDSHIQELAAAKIGDIGKDAAPAVEDLGRALVEAKEPEVRRNAALSLARIGPPSKKALSDILKALRYADSEPDARYNAVRPYAAEALVNIDYPGVQSAIPDVLKIIGTDPDPVVRQRCLWALFDVPDLDRYKITPVLTAVLDETARGTTLLRYDSARVLAVRLHDKAPAKVVDVLLEMLNDRGLLIFHQTDTKVSGVGAEGAAGKSEVQENQDGDARFLAAEALGQLGRKANRPDVLKALQEAAQDSDRKLSLKAKEALLAIKRMTAP
jgi:HEAT repeat protein